MAQQTPAPSARTSHGRLVGVVAVLLALAAMHFARPMLLPPVTGLRPPILTEPHDDERGDDHRRESPKPGASR